MSISAHSHMPHSIKLPDTLCSFYGGETSQGSCTVFSPAEVANDLGELPWRLEGREHCEGVPDSPARLSFN